MDIQNKTSFHTLSDDHVCSKMFFFACLSNHIKTDLKLVMLKNHATYCMYMYE